jgi:single-strand DNA-binding protein
MFQRVTIIGKLGRDPEMRYTPDGTAVTNFSVATSRKVSKAKVEKCPGGWKESYNGKHWEITTWFRVTVWRGLAEMCNQYLAKGRTVRVEGIMAGESTDGKLEPRVWEDNSGNARCSFEITARDVLFLGGNDGNGGSSNQSQAAQQAPPDEGVDEEEIPF